MPNPYERPCWGGPCTEYGMETPGFCKCMADADEIELLRAKVRDIEHAPLLLGQVVLAAGGSVRVPAVQLQSVLKLTVTRSDDKATGDAIFTATAE